MASSTLLIVSIALLVSLSCAYRQELILIDTKGGKVSTFYEPVMDTSDLNLKSVDRICFTGLWIFYAGKNHTLGNYVAGSAGLRSVCEDKRVAFKSFRHAGSSETTTDALSLYSGQYPYTGPEIYVDSSPFGSIRVPVKSLASTGSSKWTLFEGSNFDGNTMCWKGSLNFDAYYNYGKLTQLSTVGSVVKGCPQFVDETLRQDLRKVWIRIQNIAK